jgi:type II secretory ATPase GspE/PulE/Tfp pilus assembly ATPase PilB-like protein
MRERYKIAANVPIYQAVGCEACRNTGYHGRHGIFEMMDLTNEIRQMILQSCSSGQIREVALRAGMRSLAEDGFRLVRLGITTPEEVMRVCKEEALVSSAQSANKTSETTSAK